MDTLATITALSQAIYTAVPWLTVGTVMTSHPPDPYQGRKPYCVINSPSHSRAHRESGAVGSVLGRPNRYTIAYYETAFVANSVRTMEELRVYQTYDAIATALVTPGGDDACLPGDLAITSVSLETSERGPWVVGPGNMLYIGALLHVDIVEEYE